MQPDTQQYERQSECEDYGDYGPQGYHPVSLGERFNGKYVVHQKLGWGHFSTVWLVQNEANSQYMALKIQRSKESHSQTAIDQLQMLLRIRKHQQDEGWLNFVKKNEQMHPKLVNAKICKPLALIDNFIHHGIHGKHYCSVFELMGPNLLDLIQHYQFKNKKMPIWLVKKITIDVLMGLVHLHQFSGMIHTDLKPQNIMMKLHPQQQTELIQKLKQYKVKPISMKFLKTIQSSKSSKNKKKYQKKKLKKKKKVQGQQQQSNPIQQQTPQSSLVPNNQIEKIQPTQTNNKTLSKQQNDEKKQNTQTKQKQPQTVVEYTQQEMKILKWKNVCINLNTDVFYKIADMGNACYIEKHFTDTIQTRQYRSPEVLLGHPYDTTTDIWSLACTIFQMMTNSFLFKPKKVQGIPKDQDHLFKMIEVLGPIPKQFATQGSYSSKYFNKKGKLLHGNPKQELSLSILLIQDYGYSVEEADEIQLFLKPMLAYEPKNRISARKCLESEWLWKQ